MENEFDGVMRKRTDADLIKILNSQPDDYQPMALEAAKREYDQRNLSGEQIISATQEIELEKEIDDAKANMPLNTFSKIMAFIFPGVTLLMFAGTYKADGYNRKAKEIALWTLIGFLFYISLIVLSVMFLADGSYKG